MSIINLSPLSSFGILLVATSAMTPLDPAPVPSSAPPVQDRASAQGTKEPAAKAPVDLAWWRAARFGMFIHWGPVALKGTEIGWSRGREVPADEYDRLCERFDPTGFDADEWVDIARQAGMKYLVITAKHHDGFCLWPSKMTDHDIEKTPFKRDVLKELSEACRRAGIRFCTYYSILDWHHPDYPTDSPGGKGHKPHPDMARYFEYVKNQTRELIEGYGPLGIMWFDGQWEAPWTAEYGEALYRYLKQLQPDLIINNRVGKVRKGSNPKRPEGTVRQTASNPGDYDTPEQRIGAFNRERPWETCMTLCRQWAWKPGDKMKSLRECLRALIQAVGGDGNLLFNVGPMPDGRIEPRQAERLREMGAWLARNGEGVYGARGGPYKPGPWGASTCKGHTIHLFVFRWPEEGPLVLPPIDAQITAATLADGTPVRFHKSGEGTTLEVPVERRSEIATAIRLEVDRPAFDITPADLRRRSGSLATDMKGSASNVFRDQETFGPDKALDDDPHTRWATDAGTHAAWLEVDLGAPAEIGRLFIDECIQFGQRVRRFRVVYREGDTWREIISGTTLGRRFTRTFTPVSARVFRLEILEADEGPTIWEFQVFGPRG